MIKAVIFDMDGLLINTEEFWRKSHKSGLADIGVRIEEPNAKEVSGLRVDEAVEYWSAHYPWNGYSKKELRNKIIQHQEESVELHGKLMQGAQQILDLFEKKNIPMAIASSSPPELIKVILSTFHLEKYFKVKVSSEEVARGKPNPDVFLDTAEKLNVSPSLCLVFEDSPNGVLAAKAAKMKCVAVPDALSRNDNRFNMADLIIPSLNQFTLNHLRSLE